MVLLLAGTVLPAFLDARAAASSVTGEFGRGSQAGELPVDRPTWSALDGHWPRITVERGISSRLYEAHPTGSHLTPVNPLAR
jgi:hypothetical protein